MRTKKGFNKTRAAKSYYIHGIRKLYRKNPLLDLLTGPTEHRHATSTTTCVSILHLAMIYHTAFAQRALISVQTGESYATVTGQKFYIFSI